LREQKRVYFFDVFIETHPLPRFVARLLGGAFICYAGATLLVSFTRSDIMNCLDQ
jgi:hypothetical protein